MPLRFPLAARKIGWNDAIALACRKGHLFSQELKGQVIVVNRPTFAFDLLIMWGYPESPAYLVRIRQARECEDSPRTG